MVLFFFVTIPAPSTSTPTFLTPADIARRVGRHPNTIKDIAQQLRIDPARTARQGRLFSEADATRIINEIKRREQQVLK